MRLAARDPDEHENIPSMARKNSDSFKKSVLFFT
jgi:hypothetical protein